MNLKSVLQKNSKFIYCIVFPISFIAGIFLLIFHPENILGIQLYYMAIISLSYSKFFLRNKRKIILPATFLLVIIIFFQLKQGTSFFIRSLAEKIIFTFFCILILNLCNKEETKEIESHDTLFISDYKELSSRDAQWLIEIQQGIKYSTIAGEYNIELGSFKNRISEVYKILGLKNKADFLRKYKNFEIK